MIAVAAYSDETTVLPFRRKMPQAALSWSPCIHRCRRICNAGGSAGGPCPPHGRLPAHCARQRQPGKVGSPVCSARLADSARLGSCWLHAFAGILWALCGHSSTTPKFAPAGGRRGSRSCQSTPQLKGAAWKLPWAPLLPPWRAWQTPLKPCSIDACLLSDWRPPRCRHVRLARGRALCGRPPAAEWCWTLALQPGWQAQQAQQAQQAVWVQQMGRQLTTALACLACWEHLSASWRSSWSLPPRCCGADRWAAEQSSALLQQCCQACLCPHTCPTAVP